MSSFVVLNGSRLVILHPADDGTTYTNMKFGNRTWSIPASNISLMVADTVSESLIDGITHHGIDEPSQKEVRKQMGKIGAWTVIKDKVTEEEFRRIGPGTIIWETTAEKTTNDTASHRRPGYLPTPDGLHCFKGAPWIVEVVNEEAWSYDCRRMTRHNNWGDENLTASQLVQSVRVLYPDGKNNSSVHNLPVVNVGWCEDPLTGDEISLASLNESRTIRATRGMKVVGELIPPSKLFWLELCHGSKTTKFQAALEKLQTTYSVDSIITEPTIEVSHTLEVKAGTEIEQTFVREQIGVEDTALLAAENVLAYTTVEHLGDTGLGAELLSPSPGGYILNAAEAQIHGDWMYRTGCIASARSSRSNSI